MAESAALLVDEVLPEQPIRQWVLSFPFQLRFLFASRPQLMGRMLGIVYRIEDQPIIDKILNHLQAKGALPPLPELLPATRASPESGWFA